MEISMQVALHISTRTFSEIFRQNGQTFSKFLRRHPEKYENTEIGLK